MQDEEETRRVMYIEENRTHRHITYAITIMTVSLIVAFPVFYIHRDQTDVIKTAIEWEAKSRMHCGHCKDHPAEKTRVRPCGD